MSQESVARRYAKAIFDIGKEEGTLPRLSSEVGAFAKSYWTRSIKSGMPTVLPGTRIEAGRSSIVCVKQ